MVAVYFYLVVRLAADPLLRLYQESPVRYAVASAAVIIGQGVLLEALTSWLLRKIGLRR
jgi:hypothetical protein